MNKTEVAVCDANDVYRERFVAYLIEHRLGEFAVHAFSTPESFLEWIEEQRPDVAILGEGFATTKDMVKKWGIPLLLLEESEVGQVSEEEGYYVGQQTPCASVFRYQPMDVILHEMWVLTGARGREAPSSVVTSGNLEVIGVYSPMRHEMQMPFSVVLAEALSEKRRVVYVSFMAHSGFCELFGLSGGYDLGDIFIRLRNRGLSQETFRRSVYEMEGIYCILPFGNPEDLRQISVLDCKGLLDFLEEQTDFETAVLDFGVGIEGFGEILGYCDIVYCLTKSGFYYDCQLRDFTDYLNCQSTGQIGDHLHVIALPFSGKQIHGGGDVLRQLLWSEFGDYVRKCVTGGGA